jgi:hypothetical protein
VHLDAYAAISGQISANNELPYMTPPGKDNNRKNFKSYQTILFSVATPHSVQHFSGDSQDSSSIINF